jgi:hypothetical protein
MKLLFNELSEWNVENELRCFLIYKELEENNFPRGLQMKLCIEFSENSNLDVGNINAKVSNFKSEAGVNAESHSSEATKIIYKRYGSLSLREAQSFCEGYKFAIEQNE